MYLCMYVCLCRLYGRPLCVVEEDFRLIGWGGRNVWNINPPLSWVCVCMYVCMYVCRHQSTYSSACYDLLEGLLEFDPSRRLSATAALKHEVCMCILTYYNTKVCNDHILDLCTLFVILFYTKKKQFFREPPAMASPETFPELPARRHHWYHSWLAKHTHEIL